MILRLAMLLVIGLLAVPNLVIIAASFSAGTTYQLGGEGFSLRWYANAFANHDFLNGMALSLGLAAVATAIGVGAGIAAAFAIVRFDFAGRGALNALVMAPLIVPEAVIGLSLLIWFNAIVAAPDLVRLLFLHCLIVLPYVVRIIVANLQRTDPNLEAAARLLGAGPLRAVVLVTLPTISRGIFGAIVFAFVMSFHNFTATFFVAANQLTLPVAIFQYVRTKGDPTVAALSVLLMLFALLFVWLTERLLGLERVAE